MHTFRVPYTTAAALLLLACGNAPPASNQDTAEASAGAPPAVAATGIAVADVAGCYVLEWGDEAAEAPLLFPDTLVLLTDAYTVDFEWDGLDTLGMHTARPLHDDGSTPEPDGEWNWKQMWRGEMWWHVTAADSIRFGMGHDGSEFVGFAAAVRGGELRGTGAWTTDYQPDVHPQLAGRRITCPGREP